MSANKTGAQYANLPEDQQAAFRQDMAGAQLNPTADGSKANLGARGDKNYAQKLAQAQLTQFDSCRNSALQERVAGKMGLTQAGGGADADGDGQPDQPAADADGDGQPDEPAAGGQAPADANGDGQPDAGNIAQAQGQIDQFRDDTSSLN